MAQPSDNNQQPNYEELGLPKPPASRRAEVVAREKKEITPERKEAVAAEAIKEALQKTESAVEQRAEQVIETATEREEVRPATQEQEPQATVSTPAVQPVAAKDAELQKIESIISRGLEDEYASMTPKEQQRFREEGEKTASAIQKLLHASRIKVQKIMKLLVNWLKLIPGVNKYFLEQEAKIKADELVDMALKDRDL